jgi:cytochrome P450
VSTGEIRDEIATIITAGHETTAAALGWALYLLDLHPGIEQHLADEARRVLEDRLPAAEDVERLKFTRMVAEEALRLYPPAHTLTRIALGPDRLGDVSVPKGAVVLISPWLLHRNPTLWRDPDRFSQIGSTRKGQAHGTTVTVTYRSVRGHVFVSAPASRCRK